MLSTENLLSGPAAVEAVTGDRPAYSTFFRWTEAGLLGRNRRRVKLEFLKCGAVRKTSVEAVSRFFGALTTADDGTIPGARSHRQRDAEHEAADQFLKSENF